MVLVLSFEKDTLVVPDMSLELIIADHGVTEKTELMSCLLLLVIHELVSELCGRNVIFISFGLLLVIILTLDMVLFWLGLRVVVVMMKWRFVFPGFLMLHHKLLFLDYIFFLVTTNIAILINSFDKTILSEDVMNWCMGFLQNLSVLQVTSEGLDVIMIPSVMLAHVVLESARIVLINLPVVLLCFLNAFEDPRVFRKQIKAHLKGVVHFERVTEALLLEVSVDVAQSLGARRVLNSHFCSFIVFFIYIIIID